MARRLYLTPNSIEGGTDDQCRLFRLPLELVPYLTGAIAPLTEPWRWEQFGTMTVEEAAERWAAILQSVEETCGGDEPVICDIPADPDLGVEFRIRIIRRGAGGHTEELVDGEWVTPTGDYEVPPLPAREEATEVDRLCLAAANASNVLATMYEEITDAIAIELSAASVFGAIYDYAIAVLGLFAGATAAAYASLGKTFFDIFVETADTLGSDVWNADFTEELTCFMLAYAQDDGFGHITFEWPVMRSAITEEFIKAGSEFDIDRGLLWGQVGYLFDILAADGIDAAGATTAIDEYECDNCGDWCYTFDFTASDGGWTAITPTDTSFYSGSPGTRPPWGTYVAGQYWNGRAYTNPALNYLYINKTWASARTITRISVEYEYRNIQGTLSDLLRLYNGATTTTVISINPPNCADSGWATIDSGEISIPATKAQFSLQAVRGSQACGPEEGYIHVRRITIWGEGSNPFGSDNC